MFSGWNHPVGKESILLLSPGLGKSFRKTKRNAKKEKTTKINRYEKFI